MTQLEMRVRVDQARQHHDVARIFERHARAPGANRDDAIVVCRFNPAAGDGRPIDGEEPTRAENASHRKIFTMKA